MQFLNMKYAQRHFPTIYYASNTNNEFLLNVERMQVGFFFLNLEFVNKNRILTLK